MSRKTKTYLILSHKLDTNRSNELSKSFDVAGSIISKWFNETRLRNWTSDTSVEPLLDKKSFTGEIRSPLYKGYFKDDQELKLTERMFDIVTEVYRRSGYFLSNDLHSGNVGYTDKGEPQLFDFGYPSKLGMGRVPDDYKSPEKSKKKGWLW